MVIVFISLCHQQLDHDHEEKKETTIGEEPLFTSVASCILHPPSILKQGKLYLGFQVHY
jgi:hypothetical protein